MFLSKETDYVLGETLALERKRGSEARQQMSFDFAKGCRNTGKICIEELMMNKTLDSHGSTSAPYTSLHKHRES